jgi:hypothetical protein
MKKVMKITRIRLEDLIRALQDVHNDGAEYIDIVGTSDPHQDIIAVEVRDDYFKRDNTTGLTDDFLNDLV